MVTYAPIGQTAQVTQKAYGYATCWQLKKTRPDQVLNNADTYATLAIGQRPNSSLSVFFTYCMRTQVYICRRIIGLGAMPNPWMRSVFI